MPAPVDSPEDTPLDPPERSHLPLALALIGAALLGALAFVRSGPPPVVPADADPALASGARAEAVLVRLLGDGAPRPAGSAANTSARERLVAELERLGLTVEVQAAFVAHRDGGRAVAGTVHNVIAVLESRSGADSASEPLPALLCLSHYDGVGAGPAVSDDLAGVAAWIEVARALIRRAEPVRRKLVFLFSDGEESGLLGAEAFAESHPLAREIGAVVNLEARGTGGPSRMFETGADNHWIATAFARGASHPSATSLSTEVYRRMPNDTDYTVFRRRGVPGLNFAWIGGVARYHTPLDDLAHLDRRALQHHVSNAYDAVVALDGAAWPAAGEGRGDAVFADVAGAFVLRMGTGAARFAAFAALLLVLHTVVRAARRGATGSGRVLGGLSLALALAVCTAFAAHMAGVLDAVVAGVSRPWRARPVPAVVGMLGAALAAAALLAPLAARAVGVVGLGLGGALALALGTAFAALGAPGAAILTLASVSVLALGLAAARFRTRGEVALGWVYAAATLSLAPLTVPLGAALFDAFGATPPSVPGPSLGAALGLLCALAVPTLAPLLAAAAPGARLGLVLLGLSATAFGAVMARLVPAIDVDTPGHLAVVYAAERESEVAEWHLASSGDPVPAALLARGTFGAPRIAPRWSLRSAGAAPAPAGLLPFAELELEGAVRTAEGIALTGRLRSPAGAQHVDLEVPEGVALELEGREVPRRVRVVAVGAGGVRVRAVWPEDHDGPTLSIVERVLGAIGEAQHLVSARPKELVPAHLGDGAQLVSRIDLAALAGGVR